MALITYNTLLEQFKKGGGLDLTPSADGGAPSGGTFTGTVTIEVPQLPKIDFPMDDLTFSSTVSKAAQKPLDELLSLKTSTGGKSNNYAGSQVIINSDRVLLNAKTDYLMLFGQTGVAISSPGNVNIDADDAITLFGEDGLFLGVPGKGVATPNNKEPETKADPTVDNEYEPLVLGTKLANLIEDLLIILKNATILTPVGKGYFREDVMYEFRCLQARLPEILSTNAYVDGISHEATDPAPEPPKAVTEPPTTIVGTVTGTLSTNPDSVINPDGSTNQIADPLATKPDFFQTEELYND